MRKANSAKPRILYLDIVRTVAIISITLNHAVNRTYDNYDYQFDEFLSSSFLDTLIKTVVSVFSRVGVPLFLMLTGVLILNKSFNDNRDLKKFYQRNYLPTFITTEVWIIIMYFFYVLFQPGNLVLSEGGILGAGGGLLKNMFFLDWADTGLYKNIAGSMWYMRSILVLYPMLPLISIFLKRFSAKYLAVPYILTFIYVMVVPFLNQQLIFGGATKTLSPAMQTFDLPSFLMLYVLAGYFIGNDCFKKLKDSHSLLLAALSFIACCAYQWYAYSQPKNYLVNYDFPLLLVTASFTFDYIKRKAHLFKRFARQFAYLSKISFAIYFVHVLIVDVLSVLLPVSGAFRLILLEVLSVGGSILIIALLSKIKIFKQYLFLIKD